MTSQFRPLAASLILLSMLAPAVSRAEITLEPDGDRFGTVRADGARVSPSHWWNPYGPNVLKGDVPFLGRNNYLNLTAILDEQYDTAAANTPHTRAKQTQFNTLLFSLEYFNGQTVFRPKNVSLRGTVLVRSQQILGGDPGGNNRVDRVAVGESFAEFLIATHGWRWYDSSSARAGAQAFNADVEGLVLNDVIAGARTFSEFQSNRFQMNWAYGRLFTKDKKTGLIVVDQSKDLLQEADVAAFNFTVTDAFIPGFNVIVLAAYDDDRRNPASRLRVGYGGIATNGHLGRWVTAPAIYMAWGDSENQTLGSTGQSLGSRVLSGMGVLDVSRPTNAWNPRMTLLYAPGDRDPFDANQNGYDAIADKVAFAGGAGAGIFAGTGITVTDENNNKVTLFRKGSVLPSLRGGDTRPDFVNPGIALADIGTDVALSPRFTVAGDFTAFAFDQPKTLEKLLFPSGNVTVHREAGAEAVGQLKFKPFLNENALIAISGAALFPGKGLQDLGTGPATQLKGDARILLAF